MFKKAISLVLSFMLTAGSFSATAVSASAQISTNEQYKSSQISESDGSFADLTVKATSNLFPEAEATYNADTKEITVSYTIKGTKDMLNAQWELTYDPDVLSLSSKNKAKTVMPACPSGKIVNLKLDGMVKANASSLELYNITSKEATLCQVIFDVKDLNGKTPATTTVNLDVQELTYSEIPEGEET